MSQHEDNGARRDLVLYRIETAKEDLAAAKILFDVKAYKPANNRAYYAIFHSVNTVHALDGRAYKRHKDATANFNRDYVRTEVFPKEMGQRITGAEEFIKLVEEYCFRRLNNAEVSER